MLLGSSKIHEGKDRRREEKQRKRRMNRVGGGKIPWGPHVRGRGHHVTLAWRSTRSSTDADTGSSVNLRFIN